MKKFTTRAYQLQKNQKWVPSGMIHEGSESGTLQEYSIKDKYFDTKEEADEFFVEHFIKMGYIQIKSS